MLSNRPRISNSSTQSCHQHRLRVTCRVRLMRRLARSVSVRILMKVRIESEAPDTSFTTACAIRSADSGNAQRSYRLPDFLRNRDRLDRRMESSSPRPSDSRSDTGCSPEILLKLREGLLVHPCSASIGLNALVCLPHKPASEIVKRLCWSSYAPPLAG